MDRYKPSIGSFFVVIIAIALVMVPPQANVTEAAGANHAAHKRDARLSLPQAVSIAVTRNLRMADSRLSVREKEHQRREAFSDFFPSINLQYTATADRYKNSGFVAELAGQQDSRWTVRGNPFGGPGAGPPDYPYRIDPYRNFTLTATMTQPLFTGGKLLNDYKFAQLGVDFSAIQFEVDRQDLILDVTQAYYQLIQGEKLLEVAESSIRALEALRNQTVEFFKAGVVAKVDVLSTEGQLAQAPFRGLRPLRILNNPRPPSVFSSVTRKRPLLKSSKISLIVRTPTVSRKFMRLPRETGLKFARPTYPWTRPLH